MKIPMILSEHESIYMPSDSSDDNSNNNLIDKTSENYEKIELEIKNNRKKEIKKLESLNNKKVLYKREFNEGQVEKRNELFQMHSNVLNTKVINFGSGFKIPKRSRFKFSFMKLPMLF